MPGSFRGAMPLPKLRRSLLCREVPRDRGWGRVLGIGQVVSGSFGELRVGGEGRSETGAGAGNTRREADFLGSGAPPETSMVRRGSTVRVRQRALKIPAKRGVLLSDLVQPSTSFARRGSRVNGGSTRQRVAGNHKRFLGAPAASRSWGQVLGTNDGWLGLNGAPARVH
jgi:hypothetical protein